jgi:CRP-like cAMP-binding protein
MDSKLTTTQQDFLMKNLSPKVSEFPQNCVINQDISRYEFALVRKGIVYLCAENDNCDRSILSFFKKGECFTHNMQLPIDNGVSYFTTKEKTEIAYFNKSEILKFKSRMPEKFADITQLLSGKFEANFLFKNYILHQKTVRSKLLTFFNNEVNIQNNSNIIVPIPFSDLADYLSIERTAMMKEIRKMKDEGIITGKNRKLKINI